MEGDSDTGLVRVLFQVESFSSYWGTFVSQKDDKIILAKCSEFYEWGRGHFLYWYLDLGRFLEDFVRFLGILYWRFVVGLDHKFVVSEVEDLEKWIKI